MARADIYCDRFPVSFQEEFSAFREREEIWAARSVFRRVVNINFGPSSSIHPLPRLEKAINGLKPSEIRIDPTTDFWTAYKNAADEYDDHMVSRYVGELDTSLLFVSTSTHFVCRRQLFFLVDGFILGCHHRIHCPNHSNTPTEPLRPDKHLITPVIATKHLVRWEGPTGPHYEGPHWCHQSSVYTDRQFVCHVAGGLRRYVRETVDPALHTSLDIRVRRRPGEESSSQVRGTSKMGATFHHKIAASSVAACAPPFRYRPHRLPTGHRRFCLTSRVGGYWYRLHQQTWRSIISAIIRTYFQIIAHNVNSIIQVVNLYNELLLFQSRITC